MSFFHVFASSVYSRSESHTCYEPSCIYACLSRFKTERRLFPILSSAIEVAKKWRWKFPATGEGRDDGRFSDSVLRFCVKRLKIKSRRVTSRNRSETQSRRPAQLGFAREFKRALGCCAAPSLVKSNRAWWLVDLRSGEVNALANKRARASLSTRSV